MMRVPVPWVYVLGYLVGAGLERVAPLTPRAQVPSGVFVAGVILFAAGAVLAGWGWALFHRAGTTRVPGRASVALVTSGPYRVSRNPMYVGLALAYLGEAGMLRQAWPVVVLPVVLAYVRWV